MKMILRKWFKDSETILLARLHMLGGIVLEAIAQADPAMLQGFISARWFGIYLFVAGIVIQLARQARDKNLKGL